MPHRSLAEMASYCVRRLGEYGIAIPEGSRLATMRDVLLFSDGRPRPTIQDDTPDLATATEALRDFHMIGFALEQMDARPLSRIALKTLGLVLKDAVLPQDDSADTHGRNAQCELYVAAICMNAGLPTVFDEPDIQCELGGFTFGIVVKRIKSVNTFRMRIEKAVDQIGKQRIPGVVFADVSRLLNLPNEADTRDLADDAYRADYSARMRAFLDRHRAWLGDCFADTSAIGLIVTDHRIRRHPVTGYELSTLTMRVDVFPKTAFASMEFDQFFQRFKTGLATPPE